MRFASETRSRRVAAAPRPGSSCEPSRRVPSNLQLAPRGSLLRPGDSVSDGRRHRGHCLWRLLPGQPLPAQVLGLTRGRLPLPVAVSLDAATLAGVTRASRGTQPAAAPCGPPGMGTRARGHGNQGSGVSGHPGLRQRDQTGPQAALAFEPRAAAWPEAPASRSRLLGRGAVRLGGPGWSVAWGSGSNHRPSIRRPAATTKT